jgi:hypothetical protein
MSIWLANAYENLKIRGDYLIIRTEAEARIQDCSRHSTSPRVILFFAASSE